MAFGVSYARGGWCALREERDGVSLGMPYARVGQLVPGGAPEFRPGSTDRLSGR
jgi:hypothetical protein